MYDVANERVFRVQLNFTAPNLTDRNGRNITGGLFDKVVVLHISAVVETSRNQTLTLLEKEER